MVRRGLADFETLERKDSPPNLNTHFYEPNLNKKLIRFIETALQLFPSWNSDPETSVLNTYCFTIKFQSERTNWQLMPRARNDLGEKDGKEGFEDCSIWEWIIYLLNCQIQRNL